MTLEQAIPRLLAWLVLGTAAIAHAAEDEAPYPGFVRQSLYVQVRDGTRLAMSIYRPATDGEVVAEPLPVIFAFTPYRARYRNQDGVVVETGLSERLGLRQLIAHGYVVAVVDIRGKGASFGHRRGFQDRTEAYDGYDLVEWLARLPYSNGIVGMTGCSYLGGSTMQVATTAPPSLRAVFIGASDFDKYTFVRRGGITAQFNTRPDEPPEYDLSALPVDEDPAGVLLRQAVAQHRHNTPMGPLWYGMPYRDSKSSFTGNRFWEEVGPYTYLQHLLNADIAFYFWGNWSDEPTEQIIKATANIPSRMLIGPGSHCRPSAEIDFAGEMRRFFDYHLKGSDNGLDDQPRYTWRLQNAPAETGWIRSETLPGKGIEPRRLYLADAENGGKLLAEAPPAQRDEVTFTVRYDFGGQEYFSFWPDPLDQYGTTFTTAALEHDLAMVGFPVVDLAVSIDREDANVFAYLEDIDPSGDVAVVSFGRLAASHRKLSDPPYDNLGLPFHSGFEADVLPMTPGEPAKLRFHLLPNAWIFRTGHRIRLTITGADPRQRNLASIIEDPPPGISIHIGGIERSAIELPVMDPDDVGTGRPEPSLQGMGVDF